jgi:hypothetical protein
MTLRDIEAYPDTTQQDLLDLAETIGNWVSERFPTIETAKGSAMFHVVLQSGALVQSLLDYQKELTKNATTLLGNEDEDQIENILANLFIERDQGVQAKGLLTVTLINDVNTTISTLVAFVANNLNYYPIQNYNYTQGNNSEITIEVQASAVGVEYNVSGGTIYTSAHFNVSTSVAPNDIENGADKEPIENVITRAQESYSIRGFGNKRAIEGTLNEEFSNIYYDDIQGFGGSKMTRDINSFGVHKGSLIDIYVRTTKQKSLTTVSKTVTNSKIILDSISYSPILKIESVKINNVEIINYTVERDSHETYHLIDTARFTAFEKLTLELATNAYDTQTAEVIFWTMDDIVAIQAFADSDEIRNLMGDVLIKSVVPYEVDAVCEYKLPNNGTQYTEDEVRILILNAINEMNGGEFNNNVINNSLFNAGIIVTQLIISVTWYDDNLIPTTLAIPEEYKDFKDSRVCFFANEIQVNQV